MGKRSDFKRVERDFYPTPMAAVLPLLPHLPSRVTYSEPCAGNGALIDHLGKAGHRCVLAYDIFPKGQNIRQGNALKAKKSYLVGDYIITNPPWNRKILHPMIKHFSAIRPTWLLFDSDWCHTKQSAEFMDSCEKIVSVGRVKWFPDTNQTGKDNAAWYLFDANFHGQTEFYGR